MILIEGDPELWGIIPTFLDVHDKRGAQEQIDARYMGGWNTAKEWLRLEPETNRLIAVNEAEGDPPLDPRSKLYFRDEMLIVYDGEWVVVLRPDKSWDVARLD